MHILIHIHLDINWFFYFSVFIHDLLSEKSLPMAFTKYCLN